MNNPYEDLPDRAFWRNAIAQKNPFQIGDLWQAKFLLSKDDKIITAGSCFAQHIGKALKAQGFNWFDAEPAPRTRAMRTPRPDILSQADAQDFNYGIFSFRTGNIYTTTALLQWVEWALDRTNLPTEIWEQGGRFIDPARPRIEPDGFGSAEELHASRLSTLDAIERAIRQCSVFVFTLGLTERWINKETGMEYPLCPGTIAGQFDPQTHVFDNLEYEETKAALSCAIAKIRAVNPDCRFLLTVSPVPLTATASGDHVLVATTYSKSTLRAVATGLARHCDFVDYFPSYEIISSFPYRGVFFEPNMRSVVPDGVAHVMAQFFKGLGYSAGDQLAASQEQTRASNAPATDFDDGSVLCEEALLEAFGNYRK